MTKIITKITPTNIQLGTQNIPVEQYVNYFAISICYDFNVETGGYNTIDAFIHKDLLNYNQLTYIPASNSYIHFLEPFGKEQKNNILSTIIQYPKKVFPYKFIAKNYIAYKFLDKAQSFLKSRSIQKTKQAHLDYTFGLEFETEAGVIPEHLCLENGLIPVYDGSITGIEYTSVVLRGELGLQVLRKQFELFKKHTLINPDCSIHLHLGGMPKSYLFAFILHTLCKTLQPEIEAYSHKYIYNSAVYKAQGKNYSGQLPSLNTILSYFYFISNSKPSTISWNPEKAHPDDPDGNHKWQIHSRYLWLNVVNLLYYPRNKTVEFRFLPSTYNAEQLIGWIYVLNAIVKTAENYYNTFTAKNPDYEFIMFNKLSEEHAELKKAGEIDLNILLNTVKKQISLVKLVTTYYNSSLTLVNKLHKFFDLQLILANCVQNPTDLYDLPKATEDLFKSFTFETKKKQI